MLSKLLPNLWKYVVVALVAAGIATGIIFWLTPKPNTVVIDEVSDINEKLEVYDEFLEVEEEIREEIENRIEALKEEFDEKYNDKDLSDRIDELLGIERESTGPQTIR